jgi:hypothetical protein
MKNHVDHFSYSTALAFRGLRVCDKGSIEDVIATKNNLGLALADAGQHHQAIEIYDSILDGCQTETSRDTDRICKIVRNNRERASDDEKASVKAV